MYFVLAALVGTVFRAFELQVAIVLAQLTINSGALLVAAYFIGRLTGRGPLTPIFFTITLGWYAYALPHLLTEYWNPVALVLPFLSFVIAVSCVARGDLYGLSWALLSGTVVASHHLGSVPLVFALLFLAIPPGLRLLQSSQTQVEGIPILLLSMAVSSGLLWPVISDTLNSDNWGNLGEIYKRTVVGGKEVEHSLSEALPYLTRFLAPQGSDYFIQNPVVGIIILSLLIINGWFASRKMRSLTPLFSITLGGLGVNVLLVLGIRGPLFSYLMMTNYALIGILLFISVAPLSLAFTERGIYARVSSIMFPLLLLPLIPFHTKATPPCSIIAPQLVKELEPLRGSFVELSVTPRGAPWEPLGATVMQLRALGVSVCGPKGMEYMFGAESDCSQVQARSSEKLKVETIVVSSTQRLRCSDETRIKRFGEILLLSPEALASGCEKLRPTQSKRCGRNALLSFVSVNTVATLQTQETKKGISSCATLVAPLATFYKR